MKHDDPEWRRPKRTCRLDELHRPDREHLAAHQPRERQEADDADCSHRIPKGRAEHGPTSETSVSSATTTTPTIGNGCRANRRTSAPAPVRLAGRADVWTASATAAATPSATPPLTHI